MMDLENRDKEGEKDYEDKKTYCCGFNGTYSCWYLYQGAVRRQRQKSVTIKKSSWVT